MEWARILPATTNHFRGASDRPPRHPRRTRAQSQGRLARPPARLADRVHGALRVGQVVPGVRHDLRRGPAPLRRVAVGVRPAVPRPDGQARRRLHRGPVACGLDRPEVHESQPALDRRHDHRGLRLPPPALRPRRPAALPGVRRGDRPPDPAADRRPHHGRRGGHPLPGARADHPRSQGRVRRAVPPAAVPGLQPHDRRRRDPHARRRAAQAREAEEAHDRRRGRPPAGQGQPEAAPHRVGRDRAGPGRRPRHHRLRRPARGRRAPHAPVLREARMPQRPPARGRRARAAVVLVQRPVRRLPRVPRPRHPHGGRPRAGRPRRCQVAQRGSRRTVVVGARRRLLLPADRRARRRAGVQRRHAVGRPARGRTRGDPARAPDQGARALQEPLWPRAVLLHRVRGRDHLPRAPPRRDRLRDQPRAPRGLHARGPVPGLQRHPPQAGHPGGDARVREVRRQEHRRGLRAVDQRGVRIPPDARDERPRAPDRRARAQGDQRAAAVPARRRPRLPRARPGRRLTVRRRGAAHPAGHADRRGARRRALRPRRAVDRPAPARQPPPDRDPAAPARPRQHADRRRARRGHDPGRRLGRRHRSGRRRARGTGHRLRPGRRALRQRGLADRPIPVRPQVDPAAGASAASGSTGASSRCTAPRSTTSATST